MSRPKPFNNTMPDILATACNTGASASKITNNFHLALNVSDEEEEEAELLIFDQIGSDFFSDGITATDVVTFLSENKTRDINVRINSPGGFVFEGITIFNALARHEAKVVTTVEGIAASAAALIATVGDVVRMYENTTFMIHRALTFAMGNVADMLDVADFLGKIDGQIRDILAAKSGLSQDEVMEFMIGNVDGTAFTAAEAFEKGFADEIIPLKQKKDKKASSDNTNNVIQPNYQLDYLETTWTVTATTPEDIANSTIQVEILKRMAVIRLDEIMGYESHSRKKYAETY